MKPLRVSLLSTFGPTLRGISSYSDGLFSGLAQQGLKLSKFDYAQLYPPSLVPSSKMTEKIRAEGAIMHWAKPQTWKKVGENSAPILHIQYWSLFTSYMLYFLCRHARRMNKKVVITVHNPVPHEYIPLFSLFEDMLLTNADALIVHSDSGKQALLSRYHNKRIPRVYTIPHGVELVDRTEIKKSDFEALNLSPSKRYVLMFGNLRAYKGVPVLLKAWRKVIESVEDVDLILAGRFWRGNNGRAGKLAARILGTDAVATEVLSLLNEQGLRQRVTLREGFIPDSTIDAYCRIASIAVFPYERFSGQSGAASRAAGRGVPLIVSNVGALPLLVPNKCQVVEPENSNELAVNLCKLLSDPPLLDKLADAQKKHLKKYSWKNIGAMHATLYQELYLTVA